MRSPRILLLTGLLAAAGTLGCSREQPGGSTSTASAASGPSRPAASGSAAATAPAATSLVNAIPAEKVAKVLNPKGDPVYAGPTGTLRGIVRVKGDAPPERIVAVSEGCPSVREMYGKLFRVGKDGALADALVAVTGYQGYVPPAKPTVEVKVEECAFSTRTVALAYGQAIEVRNTDRSRTYLPQLLEARVPATLVAMPHGDPVKLYAPEPRLYQLIDMQGRPFMTADVFVLKYSTLTVTGLDGRFEIAGIPVGPVEVSALLPAARLKAVNARTEIKAGDNTLDLTIEFDAKKDAPAPAPSASASASAP